MKETSIYLCKDSQTPLIGLGDTTARCPGLELLTPKTEDAGSEKHVPILHHDGETLHVQVGSQPHPMQPDHFIEWVFLQTKQGGMYQKLSAGQAPKVTFLVNPSEVVGVYAYCNIHGLWKGSSVTQSEEGFHELVCSAEFSDCIDS